MRELTRYLTGWFPRNLCGGRQQAFVARGELVVVEASLFMGKNQRANDIIDIVAQSEMFCPHFHIPLQSGDDDILKNMRRPYTAAFFAERVRRIHRRLPAASIGADILVGFPGESDAAFRHTLGLIESLPLTYLHVFPFSSRPGTPADKYPQKVPQNTIKERCEKMRRLGNEKKRIFYETFMGKTVEVLIESKRDKSTGLLKGITSNYIPVHVVGKDDLFNKMVQVNIEKIKKNNTVFGIQY